MLLILIALVAVSCNVLPQDANGSPAGNEQEDIETPSMNLPCFHCHSIETFRDPRTFPHETHRDMGLHCNQCHIIRTHESMELNGSTCNSCHNLKLMKLSRTNMPALFDHDTHANMFGCGDCHSDIFRMKAGSTKIDMAGMYKGKYCGKCHNGRSAFASDNCGRCHKSG